MLDTSKIKTAIAKLREMGEISDYAEFSLSEEVKMLQSQSTHTWTKYDWNNPISHPPAYGKYFVQRKDRKSHWETWNGAGWAYNENSIEWWAKITPPKK